MVTGPPSIELRADVPIAVSPSDMLGLIVNFERYAKIEPRLAHAELLPGPNPPCLGSRARVTANVTFTVPLVARFVRRPSGTIEVTEWLPDHRIVCEFDSRHFVGWIRVDNVSDSGMLSVRGEAKPRHRVLRFALLPLLPILQLKATASIARVITDLESAILQSS